MWKNAKVSPTPRHRIHRDTGAEFIFVRAVYVEAALVVDRGVMSA